MFLPAATGSQDTVRVIVQTAFTSGTCIIKVANSDLFVGSSPTTTTFGAGSDGSTGGTDTLTLTARQRAGWRHSA